MASSTLCLHAGARKVERSEIVKLPEVEGTDTWFPTPHIDVLNTVETTLNNAGFSIAKSQFAVTGDGHRFFGTLDLCSDIVPGVSLAVGVRNSTDKSFPIALTAGTRVFVCDNLAFNSDIYVSKRHTRWGKDRFDEGISKSLVTLAQFKTLEAKRIEHYQACELDARTADAILLNAFEQNIVSSRLLPEAIKEWRKPSHEEFAPRNAWSLFNAFTEVLKARQNDPRKFTATTMKLYGMIDRLTEYSLAT